MTTTTKLNAKVRNYRGQNSFVLKMKETVSKYGGLTEKQASAVEKALSQPVTIDKENLPDHLKNIAHYNGQNSFVLDIK